MNAEQQKHSDGTSLAETLLEADDVLEKNGDSKVIH